MNYTPKQLQIMSFIRDYRRERGTSPTLEEIGTSLGIHRVTVHQHVGALVKKGAVQKLAQRSRSIEILDREFLPKPTIRVLGRIAAGQPIEAVEDPDDYVELPVGQVPDSCYALRVRGTSMIEDHIDDGDLVVVRPQPTVDNGDIAVAIVRDATANDGATLKRFYLEGSTVRLQPRNPDMQPILVPADQVEVRGKVVKLLRDL